MGKHDPIYGPRRPSPLDYLVDAIVKKCRRCQIEKHHSFRSQKYCDDCRKEIRNVR